MSSSKLQAQAPNCKINLFWAFSLPRGLTNQGCIANLHCCTACPRLTSCEWEFSHCTHCVHDGMLCMLWDGADARGCCGMQYDARGYSSDIKGLRRLTSPASDIHAKMWWPMLTLKPKNELTFTIRAPSFQMPSTITPNSKLNLPSSSCQLCSPSSHLQNQTLLAMDAAGPCSREA